MNESLLACLLLAMAAVVFANVAGRALTGQSFGWGDELARQMLVWMVMISVGLVLRRGGHLALTVAFSLLPDRAGRWLKRLVLIIVIAFSLYAAYAGYGYAMMGVYQHSPVLGVPYSYVYVAIPVGFLLLVYHTLACWREFVTSNDEFEFRDL